ncbi:MAG: hypothetical protein J2P28_02350 [Actinobacteria bacterium]|nr:hypothetical protein [Actinomycetota bacterium]
MRDPELMQRADRAAIALEEAWERWRGMHGLGTEPLPPVSSYVGYSLEEPWGQPRVVFGLRSDEAELLASLLDGHDCVGPIYTEVSTRSEWRQPADASGPQLRSYGGNSVSVPAQARRPVSDQVGAGGSAGRGLEVVMPLADGPDDVDLDADEMPAMDSSGFVVDSEPETMTVTDGGGAATGRAGRSRGRRPAKASRTDTDAAEGEPGSPPEAAVDADPGDAGGGSPPLAPLPEITDFPPAEDAVPDGEAATSSARRPSKPVKVPAQGPGYRGPRYQGYPPRYDPDTGSRKAAAKADQVAEDDGPRPAATRRSPVAKLKSGARRRATSS